MCTSSHDSWLKIFSRVKMLGILMVVAAMMKSPLYYYSHFIDSHYKKQMCHPHFCHPPSLCCCFPILPLTRHRGDKFEVRNRSKKSENNLQQRASWKTVQIIYIMRLKFLRNCRQNKLSLWKNVWWVIFSDKSREERDHCCTDANKSSVQVTVWDLGWDGTVDTEHLWIWLIINTLDKQ